MDAMVERIEKLERSVRRFRRAGGAVFCLGVVGLVMGQKAEPKETPKVIVVDSLVARNVIAEQYTLVGNSEIRGTWGMIDDTAAFEMYPPGSVQEDPVRMNYEGSLSLKVGPGNSMILFKAEGGRYSVWNTQRDGTTGISLCRKGDSSSFLSTWDAIPELGSSFTMSGAGGHSGMELMALPNGANLVLLDAKGRHRAVLGHASTVTKTTGVTHEHPESSLVLFDEKGNVVHQVP